jgi:hypothetical protein
MGVLPPPLPLFLPVVVVGVAVQWGSEDELETTRTTTTRRTTKRMNSRKKTTRTWK